MESPMNRSILPFLAAGSLAVPAAAQVPDLLNSFDAGSSSLGAGSALQVSSADTLSSYFNPAGLGYLYRPQAGLAYRNLPSSSTGVAGNLNDLQRFSTGEGGPSAITHLGYAFPFRDLFRRGAGTLSVSFTTGGYLSDNAVAIPGQTISIGGGLGIANFAESRSSRTDFFTLAYGRTNGAQTLAYGFGLTYATQNVKLNQTGTVVDGQGNAQPGSLSPLVQREGSGSGVGLIAGMQYTPPKMTSLSFGLSYRTQIELSGNSGTSSLSDEIPARLLGGISYRTAGLRRGRDDFAVFGVQYTQFFSAGDTVLFPRNSQNGVHFGVEYVLVNGSRRIPLRLGYVSFQSGGAGFDDRKALTYGFGLRVSERYAIDANFTRPNGAPGDLAITATYRF